jgi:uroporphyrinogen-III synthase
MHVIVTRPEPDNLCTAEALKQRGHEPWLIRLINIVPRIVSPLLAMPDCLVATSAHAFANLPGPMARSLAHLPVWTVGERTAAAARDAGFHLIKTGPGDAVGLAKDMIPAMSPGSCITYLAGQPRKPMLEDRFKAAGLLVETILLYEAIPVAEPPAALMEALTFKDVAVLHFSRASAEAFSVICAQGGLQPAARHALHVCLSKDVAIGLAGIAPSAIRIALKPDGDSLLAALDGSFMDDDGKAKQ